MYWSVYNNDIIAIQGDLRQSIDRVVSKVRHVERDAMLSAKREPRLSNEWFDAIRGSISELDAALTDADQNGSAVDLVKTLRQVVSDAEAKTKASEAVFESLADLGDQSDGLKDAMFEMPRLEERLQSIIETCGNLVRRLSPEPSQSRE